ncbi:hypothetical protein F6X39_30530, partial [Paraburkholderia sp. UCT2]|nr:hypothetical protein [Paraburkholderia sp. UCT2]
MPIALGACRLVSGKSISPLPGSVYIWNARALPREGPLARIATPRILDVFARSMTQRAALLAATPVLNFIP